VSYLDIVTCPIALVKVGRVPLQVAGNVLYLYVKCRVDDVALGEINFVKVRAIVAVLVPAESCP